MYSRLESLPPLLVPSRRKDVHDETMQLLLFFDPLRTIPPTFHHFTGDLLRGQSRPPTLFAPVPSDTVVSSDSNSSASPFFHPSLPSFSFVSFLPERLFVPQDKDIYVAIQGGAVSKFISE